MHCSIENVENVESIYFVKWRVYFVFRDALIVTSLDTVTSLIAGCTIFGILGNLAHEMNLTDIDKVVTSGASLAFISYPDAIAKFSVLPQVKRKKKKFPIIY